MAKAVCNSSPIIGLSIIGELHLLWDIFNKVYIPGGVYEEVVSGNLYKHFGELELKNAVENGYINVYRVKNMNLAEQMSPRLHRGEQEVIIAAKELEIQVVVIDDKLARDFADAMLLKSIGVIGILETAKRMGKIDQLKKYIDVLVDAGFWISKKLYAEVLGRVGEYY